MNQILRLFRTGVDNLVCNGDVSGFNQKISGNLLEERVVQLVRSDFIPSNRKQLGRNVKLSAEGNISSVRQVGFERLVVQFNRSAEIRKRIRELVVQQRSVLTLQYNIGAPCFTVVFSVDVCRNHPGRLNGFPNVFHFLRELNRKPIVNRHIFQLDSQFFGSVFLIRALSIRHLDFSRPHFGGKRLDIRFLFGNVVFNLNIG